MQPTKSYIKKSSILNIHDTESRWYYFTADDLDTNERELIDDMAEVLGMSPNGVLNSPHFRRLERDGYVNINSRLGMNDVEPERIILRNEGFYSHNEQKLSPGRGLSGYLMPDGNFYWADFTQHSVLMQELLDLDNYKNYLQSDHIAIYFSTVDGGIVLFDTDKTKTGKRLTDESLSTLKHLQQFLTEKQQDELEMQLVSIERNL